MTQSNARRLPGWQVVRLLKANGVRQDDIGRAAGVSHSVVSRVIHRLGGVRAENEAAVWDAIERMTSRPPSQEAS